MICTASKQSVGAVAESWREVWCIESVEFCRIAKYSEMGVWKLLLEVKIGGFDGLEGALGGEGVGDRSHGELCRSEVGHVESKG